MTRLTSSWPGFSSGVIGYRREKLIDYRTAKALIVVSVQTIVVFSVAANLVSSLLLKGIYGGMIIGLAVTVLQSVFA